MKHLKRCGLAALLVVALTAMVGVSAATATEFHATGGTALKNEIVTVHRPFTLTGWSEECAPVVFNGTAAAGGTAQTQKLHPEYSHCKQFGAESVNINTQGCNYEFNANTTTVNLVDCTNGGINISFNAYFGPCKTFVPNQNGINGISYINMNTAPNRTLTVETASTNIKGTVTESGGLCPLTAGEHNNITYEGVTGVMGTTGETFRE